MTPAMTKERLKVDLEKLAKQKASIEREVMLRVDKARWWAFNYVPHYAALAANLKDQIVWSPQIPTAATDGKRIFWNPIFVRKLNDSEMRFVLLHETMHCFHLHFWRLPRNSKGNRAGDYVINAVLRTINGISMPKDGLYDPQYENLAEEEVLARLPDQPNDNEKQPGEGDGDGGASCDDPGGCGGFLPPDDTKEPPKDSDAQEGGSSPGIDESLRDRWERALIQAEISAKVLGQGGLDGNFERIIRRIRAADLDWRTELADFVRTVSGVRNDWTRSSKRHAFHKVIYPRKHHDGLGTIIFIRDTSGSICDEELAEQAFHIDSCMAENNCEGILLDNDTHVRHEYRLSAGESAPLTAVGGGGTDFRYIPEYVRNLMEEGIHVSGVIVFSDGCGAEFTDADWPELPLLWILKNAWSAYPPRDTAKVMQAGRTIHVI